MHIALNNYFLDCDEQYFSGLYAWFFCGGFSDNDSRDYLAAETKG